MSKNLEKFNFAFSLIAIIISIGSFGFSIYSYRKSNEQQITVLSSRVREDYPTTTKPYGATLRSFWELTISNNSEKPISIIKKDLWRFEQTPLKKEQSQSSYDNLDQGLYDENFKPINLPLDIDAGKSRRIFIAVGVWLSHSAESVISANNLGDSLSSSLVEYELAKNHIDIFGNPVQAVVDTVNQKIFSLTVPPIAYNSTYVLTMYTSKGKKFIIPMDWYKSMEEE